MRVSYNGHYITFPRLGRGFDSPPANKAGFKPGFVVWLNRSNRTFDNESDERAVYTEPSEPSLEVKAEPGAKLLSPPAPIVDKQPASCYNYPVTLQPGLVVSGLSRLPVTEEIAEFQAVGTRQVKTKVQLGSLPCCPSTDSEPAISVRFCAASEISGS